MAAAAADRDAAEFVARARLLDLPAAVLGEVAARTSAIRRQRASRGAGHYPELLVADLSSMWAGPLCGHLLAAAGATVVKVEGRSRPDGTRRGDPRFFDWMNSSKLSYAIDFRDDDLRPLLEVADVVIEGSRPAALTRRGLGPEQVRGAPGRVWLRITGYGTEGDRANRVAFGDDAAVAGGLVGPRTRGAIQFKPGIRRRRDRRPADRVGSHAGRARRARPRRRRDRRDRPRGGGGKLRRAAARQRSRKIDEPPQVPAPARRASELGADNRRVRELIEARLATC